jgi:hypothetical protein
MIQKIQHIILGSSFLLRESEEIKTYWHHAQNLQGDGLW